MVACVLTMNDLESFTLEYRSSLSRPNRASRRPPPPTRVVFPSLTRFRFHGASEYLEDFLALVDSPLLNFFHITFFNQLAFDLSQLPQFIGRTKKIKALTQAALAFYNHIETIFSTQTRTTADHGTLVLRVSCRCRIVGLAAFVTGAALQFGLASPPPLLNASTFRGIRLGNKATRRTPNGWSFQAYSSQRRASTCPMGLRYGLRAPCKGWQGKE